MELWCSIISIAPGSGEYIKFAWPFLDEMSKLTIFFIFQSFKQCHPGSMDLYSSIQYPHVEISEEAVDLLEGLLQLTPALRFDFDQICAHSFFKGTNWEELAQNGTNSI